MTAKVVRPAVGLLAALAAGAVLAFIGHRSTTVGDAVSPQIIFALGCLSAYCVGRLTFGVWIGAVGGLLAVMAFGTGFILALLRVDGVGEYALGVTLYEMAAVIAGPVCGAAGTLSRRRARAPSA